MICRGGEKSLQFPDDAVGELVAILGHWRHVVAACGIYHARRSSAARRVRSADGSGVSANRTDRSSTCSITTAQQRTYITGLNGTGGPAIKTWPEMRLPKSNPNYTAVGGDGEQSCKGDLIRSRTLTGICNDVLNPLMGSNGTPFARNVEFETTFPDLGQTELTRNRHGNRLGLLTPDPQVISRVLFTRAQSDPAACSAGFGLPGNSPDAKCDYQKAPFFNVLAAYWIQFMTHDWFSHMEEGHNAPDYMPVGCTQELSNNVETPLTADLVKQLGCRPDDRVDRTACPVRLSSRYVFQRREGLSLARAQDRSRITTRRGGTLYRFIRMTRLRARKARFEGSGEVTAGTCAWQTRSGLFAGFCGR